MNSPINSFHVDFAPTKECEKLSVFWETSSSIRLTHASLTNHPHTIVFSTGRREQDSGLRPEVMAIDSFFKNEVFAIFRSHNSKYLSYISIVDNTRSVEIHKTTNRDKLLTEPSFKSIEEWKDRRCRAEHHR